MTTENELLRDLTIQEVDAVAGTGTITRIYRPSNAWEDWMARYFGIGLVEPGASYGGGSMVIVRPA